MSHHNRDVIVIGGSAGGLSAISRVVERLPRDLSATVLVALHVAPRPSSTLHLSVCGEGKLTCVQAKHGDPLQHGRIYVAPPDRHMRLVGADGHIRVQVDRGPRENRSRPSIDVLFRSAAATCRGRVIGILMSGYLDDGVVGLSAIRRCGGRVLVQDPADAEVPDLPLRGLQAAGADFRLTVDQMPAAIVELVKERILGEKDVPRDLESEAKLAARASDLWPEIENMGQKIAIGCPHCGGTLWSMSSGQPDEHYRCHVGHSFAADSLMQEQDVEIERALHTAVRVIEEKARFLRKLGGDLEEGPGSRFREEAEAVEADAETLRNVLLGSHPRKS